MHENIELLDIARVYTKPHCRSNTIRIHSLQCSMCFTPRAATQSTVMSHTVCRLSVRLSVRL